MGIRSMTCKSDLRREPIASGIRQHRSGGPMRVLAFLVAAGWIGVLSACSQSAPASEMSDSEVIERFHEIFYDGPATWQVNKWLGIEALQNPNDVWITQEIIVEVVPDFIIETGTRHGGSACLWAMILKEVNPDGKVITIDINEVPDATTRLPIWMERVEFRRASSTDSKLVAELTDRVRGKKVLVILDSNHSANHVYDELRAYGPMINRGSYLIVQDTNVNGNPVIPDFGAGPMEAVHQFLADTTEFEVDSGRERFLLTMNPKGFLRRAH
jgi:cephalosporin hydroxylase